MQKVVLVTLDKVTKEFQVVENLTYVCKDTYSASHLLILVEDKLHTQGYRINNVKMKNINLFSNDE